MSAIYIFVVAALLPNGEMKFLRMEVFQCPEKEVVEKVFEEKIKNNEIVAWGGTCFIAPGQSGVKA
jgi:predicted PolB exonuclease-like 3'-5' exonuclease